MAKYTVFNVAKWFLSKESMTQKRLQKLCYYAEAWHYALCDSPLTGENFEAWVHGPVSPSLWKYLSRTYMREIEVSEFSQYADISDPDDVEFLDLVWNTYKDLGGDALEVQTHSELPWRAARAGVAPNANCDRVIDPKIMKEYYNSILELDYGE